MSKFKKLVALALATSLFLTSSPLEIFAEWSTNIEPIIEDEAIIESEIIGEVEEKREENVKYFIKEDKSYEAAIYPGAIHYKDEDEWKEIDNSLSESVDSESNQRVLETKQNEYDIQFAQNTESEDLVKIKKDKYKLSWNIYDPISSFASVVPKENIDTRSLSENERIKIIPEITSAVEFKDVYENVDLKYDVISKEVKESIIIKDKIDNPVFKFNLNMENLVPKLLEDKTIVFYDSEDINKEIFSMSAPFMYDANSEESTDIQVSLQEDNNLYTLELKPNVDWINSSDRQYPIIIDPSVSTPIERTKIQDAHVSQSYGNSNFKNSVMLKTGKGSSSGVNRTYMSFELPKLNTGDLITNAILDMSLYTSNSTEAQVDVHKVLSAWNSSTITWNNKPNYNSRTEDYALVKGSEGQFQSWNISNIVKEWYSTGNNYGLMIKNKNESNGYNEYFSSDTSSYYDEYRPQVTISYINNSGLEDYWTYHSQDINRAGTGYVNDYNGNLILVHDDLSMDGNRMPVSINHVFNSNDRSSNTGYGMGWRLNLSQRLAYKIINGTQYYIYTDEDGTKHYLECVTTYTYKDESGLDLTMNIDTASKTEKYKLKDKGGNQLSFNSDGYLTYIKDNNDNKITLGYSGTNLKTVTDGSGKVINLNIDSNGRLLSIVDPSNRTTSYTYDGSNRLTKITYPDSKYTTYTYDGNNNLTSATNFDGYKISYSYYNVSPYRVQKIQESNTDGTLGEELSVSYGNNTTTFTDYKGRKNIYQFNNLGNTINIKDNDGSAQYYGYFENGGNKNKLNSQSKLQKTILNYIPNHNIEYSGYWNVQNTSNSTGSSTITSEEKNIGNKSLKVEKTNNVGDHNHQQVISVQKGKTYTLSGYIKTKNVSAKNNQGATLYMTYERNDGSWGRVTSQYINGTKDWDRYEVTFTVPSDAKNNNIVVKAGIVGETGIAYFDNLQLEDGKIANRYNLAENQDFLYGSDMPTFWNKNGACETSEVLTTVSNQPASLNNKAFKIVGNASKNKNISQKVYVSGKKGDTIVFGGWSKGEPVPGRNYAIDIGIEKLDGTYQWSGSKFNWDSSEWQYTSKAIIAEDDYKSINVYALYYHNANTAYFDGIQLYKEEFDQSFQYDANGNLISTKDLDKQNSKFEYNKNNDLIKATDPKGNNFKYNYDSKRNMLDATSAENVVYSFTYDAYGNPLTSKVGDNTLFSKMSSTYTSNGNYQKTSRDSEGNVETYNYNEKNGNLNSLTDAKGKTTSYTYDNMDRLQTTSKVVDGKTISNNYSYKNDNLSSISHNGFNYNFDYDSLGNNTSVSIGSQKLITNDYEPRSSKLLQSRYGNNQKVRYTYDNEDRIILKSYNDRDNRTQDRFKYDYDGSGNLGYHEDLVNKVNYRYIYDLSDRLVKIKESNGNETIYNYDSNNNNSKTTEKVNGNTYITSYGYDKDDKPTSITTPKGKNISHTYDKIGRVSSSTINTGSKSYTTKYTYLKGEDGSTTDKIESIENNGNKISYTYDKNGNIEIITENSKTTKYYYNELNELIKEEYRDSKGALEKTIKYYYDGGGNILKREVYKGESTIPTVTSTSTPYDDNWKDKFTGLTTRSIYTDEVGNPLQWERWITDEDGKLSDEDVPYEEWIFEWEEGRQLSKINRVATEIEYKYNADGIRTEKIIDGVSTKYHVVDDKVTFENNGKDKIYYTYDSDDKLVSMELNGVEYYYIRNIQGDIIGLIDISGEQVVSYKYDTWGRLLSIEGSLKDSLGIKNPYRYRGYRYDNETEFYYLQSRYYNPEWGRFLNADGIVGETGDLLSHNMYAYCKNNPVNMEDPDGYSPILVARVLVTGVKVAAKVYKTAKTVKKLTKATKKYRKVMVNVSKGKNWVKKSMPKGSKLGRKLKSSDMNKNVLLDSKGKRIGEVHRGQPQYIYKNNKNTGKRTGKTYPKHYHLDKDKYNNKNTHYYGK